MTHSIRVHYDNGNGFLEPVMWVWVSDGATLEREVSVSGQDDFGVFYDMKYNRSSFNLLFKDGKGQDVRWEPADVNRVFHREMGDEIWVRADRHNIYNVLPAEPVGDLKEYYEKIRHLLPEKNHYIPDTDVSGLGIPSLLGANILTDGSILFGFFHPRAARVFLTGNINDWQCPGHAKPRKKRFIEMDLYRGYYYLPNIWLARIEPLDKDMVIEYKFYLQGGSTEMDKYVVDPYTRVFSDDYKYRNAVVVNPREFSWTDQDWKTPDIKDLILYELNIYGFTDNDADIPDEIQGTFKGVTRRIKEGYFEKLGVNVLALMPTAEVPVKRGLGYEPCTFMAVEKDFGTPDDFREMVNEAHKHRLAVIIDQVFNHTSNEFNPLWNLIDDGSGTGGFYFAGETMWGNKVATGKDEVDNMLIDSCKLFIKEYHIDGFRFDATHSYFLNHKLLLRIAHEIKDKGFKADTILIAENLPNERDINLDGYNGYAQWCNVFHDKVKALLREGEFENMPNDTSQLGSMFYFGKDSFAAHTNNVINYCESHDENSVQFEVATGGAHLQTPEIKERKARLGLFSTMVALGQPMIYMGQEFGIERERNRIKVPWNMAGEGTDRFYQWTCGLINLRKKYEELRISGYNPSDDGLFSWVVAPWLKEDKGGEKRVVGWRVKKSGDAQEGIMVLLNFEGHDVPLNTDFIGQERLIKLADIENIYDLSASSVNDEDQNREPEIQEERPEEFVLPPYGAFIYRFEPQTVGSE